MMSLTITVVGIIHSSFTAIAYILSLGDLNAMVVLWYDMQWHILCLALVYAMLCYDAMHHLQVSPEGSSRSNAQVRVEIAAAVAVLPPPPLATCLVPSATIPTMPWSSHRTVQHPH